MKVIVLLLLLCFALESSANISVSSDNGVSPPPLGRGSVFMINFGDGRSLYEAVIMMLSKNYFYLEFNKMRSNRSMYGSTCFQTRNWEDVRERNLNSSSDLTFIFSRNPKPFSRNLKPFSRNLKPHPVPLPIPMPFYRVQSQEDSDFNTPDTYQMISQEFNSWNQIMSEETTTVKFFTPAKEVSSVDLFNFGFTDYVPCSEL